MKTRLIFLFVSLLILCSITVHARRVASTISNVTIYSDGAKVTRIVTVPLDKGITEIEIPDLPNSVIPASIQLNGRGDWMVLRAHFDVVNKIEHINEERHLFLAGIIPMLKQSIDSIALLQQVIKEEEQMLKANIVNRRDSNINLEQFDASMQLVRTKLTVLKQREFAIKKQIANWRELRDKYWKEADTLRKELFTSHKVYKVVFQATTAQTATFSITYLVSDAGWQPTYDLVANNHNDSMQLITKAKLYQSTGENWDGVDLVLSSNKSQQVTNKQSLRTWRLSMENMEETSRLPKAGQEKYPKVNPVYVLARCGNEISGAVFDEQEPIAGASVMVPGTNIGVSTNLDGEFSLNVPRNATHLEIQSIGMETKLVPIYACDMTILLNSDALEMQGFVISGYSMEKSEDRSGAVPSSLMVNGELQGHVAGLSSSTKRKVKPAPVPQKLNIPITTSPNSLLVEYGIDLPFSVPSDGASYELVLKNDHLKTEFSFECAPKIQSQVFLIGTIYGLNDLNLLPGSAKVFYQGNQLGHLMLNPVELVDSARISLGIDNKVKIVRSNPERTIEQKLLKQPKEARTWQISTTNYKTDAVDIIIEEQFPVTNEEDIKIKYMFDKGVVFDEERGIAKWTLTLAPKETVELSMGFEVIYPKQAELQVNTN